MHTVQIVMTDHGYAAALEALLVRDGQHRVLQREQPDFHQVGVVVMDTASFSRLAAAPPHPELVILVAGKQEDDLRKAWETGLRSVVYTDDPPQTTHLAVMAAELRHPNPVESDAR